MRSLDLALEVEKQILACRQRVMGVGDQQYSQGDMQKFESMDLDELIRWAYEEIDDVVVYATMIRIRLSRIMSTVQAIQR